jgi:hypothetical protein
VKMRRSSQLTFFISAKYHSIVRRSMRPARALFSRNEKSIGEDPMEQMLAWTLIKHQFGKIRHGGKARAEDRYYASHAGWSGPFRRPRSR